MSLSDRTTRNGGPVGGSLLNYAMSRQGARMRRADTSTAGELIATATLLEVPASQLLADIRLGGVQEIAGRDPESFAYRKQLR